MEQKWARVKKVYVLLAVVMVLIASMLLTSCGEKEVVDKKVSNFPSVLYVEEFDAEMNNIREAVDACDITLRVKYNDGSSDKIPLKFDMLEDEYKEQLNSEGRHYISYTYKGEKIRMEVLVQLTQSFTVRFLDNADNVISEQKVKKGEAAVEPTETERAVDGYTFVKWDKSFKKVNGNLDVRGIYEKVTIYYNVRFLDNNDNLITEQKVEEGKAAVEPTEAERNVDGYTFIGWDKAFDNVTSDLEIRGEYEKIIVYYTVRFLDNRNNVISEQKVEEGKAAVEPTEAERDVPGFIFKKWNKSFDNVTSDLDVRGVYNKITVQYTVRFLDNNDNVISEQKVEEGKAAVEPTEAERKVIGYTFIKWDKAFDNVTSDLDVRGLYGKIIVYYTVRFLDNNDNVISTQKVVEGNAAVEPTEAERNVAGYTFIGWDKTFDNVTGDLDVRGVYNKIIVYYTVRFLDNNDNVITEQKVEEGKAAIEPTEAERNVDGYTFVGWDKTFDNVTSDLDVRGLYEEAAVRYTVAFYNCKNELIETQYVVEGEDAKEPAASVVYVPGYIFSKWDAELTNITKDTEIYGVYISDNFTDTDGDGITDYIEIEILNLNYLLVDTDGDGITDDKEDTDNDGLLNLNEINSFLKPNDPDTDGDGLIDGDEVDVYWTLPADPDTDGDGANDGWEIKNGFDPLDYNDTFEVKEKVEMPSSTEITIEIPEISGGQIVPVIVEPAPDEAIQNVHGSIGEAIQYNVTASASITFSSNEISTAEDPVVMYFNNETKQVESIPVSVSGNEATASITEYGSYVLVDRKVFEEKGQWRDVYTSGSYTSAEIVLVIDDSGSLGGDYGYNSYTGVFTGGKDPTHLRLKVARDFVDRANINAKISIVKFDGVIDDMTNGFVVCDANGKTALKNKLQFTYTSGGEYNRHNIFDSRGVTYMYGGIKKALTMFSSSSSETLKSIVVFTDGQAHDTEYHSSVINTANANGVNIYTVGLGTSSYYFEDYLKPLASRTGGEFYSADKAEQLSNIFNKIGERIDIQTDSDSDGLADFFESGVDASGNPTLPTINGMNFVGLDKNNPDTDGDGYKDGEEIEIYKYFSDKKPGQVMIWGIVNSDPTNASSIPAA